MVYITRRERFSAAHRLFNPEWTMEKNYHAYGKCSNPNWHGHNYELWVTIKGEVNPKLGYLVDLKELSNILKDYVIDIVDHRNLNLEVDFMQGKIISTENLAISIWEQIETHIKKLNVQLHSVKVQETENNYAEYFGN
jgi:6-pyruvoyltetrahydropterin/6-carboxytetrahydropterin synthase